MGAGEFIVQLLLIITMIVICILLIFLALKINPKRDTFVLLTRNNRLRKLITKEISSFRLNKKHDYKSAISVMSQYRIQKLFIDSDSFTTIIKDQALENIPVYLSLKDDCLVHRKSNHVDKLERYLETIYPDLEKELFFSGSTYSSPTVSTKKDNEICWMGNTAYKDGIAVGSIDLHGNLYNQYGHRVTGNRDYNYL